MLTERVRTLNLTVFGLHKDERKGKQQKQRKVIAKKRETIESQIEKLLTEREIEIRNLTDIIKNYKVLTKKETPKTEL